MRRHDVPDSMYWVDAQAYPQIVDLFEPGDCLGTLVAPGWVLTAAHCAVDVPQSGHSLSIAGLDRPVDGVVCHAGYEGDEHDIALLKLGDEVQEVAPLPLYRDEREEGETVSFVGRGDSGTGVEGQQGSINDGRTREASNTVARVHSAWLEFVFNEPGDAAVTPLEGLSGDGDSGGPAFIETSAGLAVAGLSSWQDASERNVGKYGAHDFYTRVSSYLDFIDTTTTDDWDGQFRSCTEESGCCQIGGPLRGTPSTAWIVLALAGLFIASSRRHPSP